jgi:hypothetical protein
MFNKNFSFDSDFSTDAFEKQLNDTSVRLCPTDSLVLMSFRLPLSIKRNQDDSFSVEDATSPIYPMIFKLKNQFNF